VFIVGVILAATFGELTQSNVKVVLRAIIEVIIMGGSASWLLKLTYVDAERASKKFLEEQRKNG
jgi:large-conductance mechanosensitive channel